MLLRNRPPRLDNRPEVPASGFEHLAPSSLAVTRWLAANRVDYVLVGPVARAIRGGGGHDGPIAIVAAPYGRNLDRLARALSSAHARERREHEPGGHGSDVAGPALRLTAEKLLRPERWALRCGEHELDVEGHAPEGPRYQDLVYEATRFELGPELAVEVAAAEHIEHFEHVRRTGAVPEIRVSRLTREPEPS